MNKILETLYTVTGGRPMKLIEKNYIWDGIATQYLHHYVDKFGKQWLATTRCAIDRSTFEDAYYIQRLLKRLKHQPILKDYALVQLSTICKYVNHDRLH